MVARDTMRASGRTTVEEVTREVAETAEQPSTVELPEERQTRFKTTGFSRMSLDWGADDQIMMTRIHRAVDKKIDEFFEDLIALQYELLMLVRECETNAHGDVIPDGDGLPTWKRTNTGLYVEDWSKLSTRERTDWIFRLQMHIIDWERRSTEAWAEAMFAKAKWEDMFSIGFESIESARATVNDREARGKLHSRDARYFALFVTYYSRMAEGLVRNMRDLLMHLSRVHQAASGR